MKKLLFSLFIAALVLSSCLLNNDAFDISFLRPGDNGSFEHATALIIEFTVNAGDEDFYGTVEIYIDNNILDTLYASPFIYTLTTNDLQLGEHTFKAKASQDGKTSTGELSFTLTGNAPIANFSVNPTSATTDTVFYFSADECTDVESTLEEMTFEWDFNNDGVWDGVGMQVFQQFHQNGNYTVRLRVTDAGGLATEITEQVNVSTGSGSIPDNFSLVESGSFRMSDRVGSFQDVTLTKNIFMSQHEVSISEYLAFLSEQTVDYNPVMNGNIIMGIGSAGCPVDIVNNVYQFTSNAYFSSEHCPVAKISWYGALEYCNWLSDKQGLTPCYTISRGSASCSWSANGYRLPTEAEWEFAARGGIKTKENYTYAGSNYAPSVAVYDEYTGVIPSSGQIESKLPNELGLHDMTGNIQELCWDTSGDYANTSVTDPLGAASGGMRVNRGGAYSYGEHLLDLSKRENYSVIGNSRTIGFRVVRNAP